MCCDRDCDCGGAIAEERAEGPEPGVIEFAPPKRAVHRIRKLNPLKEVQSMLSCPYCVVEKPAFEIEGLRLHKFSDRWIACEPSTEERSSFLERTRTRVQASPAVRRCSMFRVRFCITQFCKKRLTEKYAVDAS